MSTNATKTCPECSAINVSADLFCKECGSSLVSVSGGYQQTAAFIPVSSDQTGTIAIAPISEPSVYQPIHAYTGAYEPIEESPRGAVLGWIAATIMLVLIGFFVWAVVFSDATRDQILGIF
ncbi:MAG: zinc ribbon domain-containing protein [Thermomicrobiales bacterium]|nr:zinc ribbon domain-containing protein [Thermomicrobiales bacterium]